MQRKSKIFQLFHSICGVFLFISGVVLFVFSSQIYEKVIQKNLKLGPYSLLFKFIQTPPVEITLDVYFFNWTNPEDFKNPNIKPKFQQIGPYRFIDKHEKKNVTFNTNNSTLTYERVNSFFFDAKNSNGSLSDVVVQLNPIAVTASNWALTKYNFFQRKIVDVALSLYGQNLSITKTVGELTFEGYVDPVVSLAYESPSYLGFILQEVNPFERIGWLFNRNGTSFFSGVQNIGADTQNLGQSLMQDYKSTLRAHTGECARVKGSSGEIFGQNLEPNGTVSVFVPDLCRDLKLDYEGQKEVHGVNGYVFSGGKKVFQNGSENPENSCYFSESTGHFPSGVAHLSECWYKAPVYMSYPHFYEADPTYLNAVEGLMPDEEKHKTYAVIEPNLGLGMEMVLRLQANLRVGPNPFINLFRDVPELFFPVLWGQERAKVSSRLATILKIVLHGKQIFQVIGVIISLFGLYFCFAKFPGIHGTASEIEALVEENLKEVTSKLIEDFERKDQIR